MGALRFYCARGGKDENVFGIAFAGQFDGWFGANKFDFGVKFTEIFDALDCGGVASDDDDFGAFGFEGFNVFYDDFHEFFI